MMKVTFIRVGDLPVTNWSLYTKFTSSVSSGQVATKLRDWTTSDRCTGLFEDQVATKRTVRIRGKIKDVCCDLGQCSLLFKWNIWRPSVLFEDQEDYLKTSLKTRRLHPVLKCQHPPFPIIVRQEGNIFANYPVNFYQFFFCKDKYNCFCKLAKKMWSSTVFFLQMIKIIFLNCPLAKRAMSTVQCSNYLCNLSGSSYRWWME